MPRSTVHEDGPHPVDTHVGRRVCTKRLSLGYNQSDLGRALGLTFQQVQKYEKGSNRISASKLWDTARFFDVDIGYFFEGLNEDVEGSSRTGGIANDAMPTRTTLEITRIAHRLSTSQQKAILALMQELDAAGTHQAAAADA